MSSEHMTFSERLAMLNGEDLETVKKRSALNEELEKNAKLLNGRPPTEWPKLNFNWDTSSESQRFALDGISPADFSQRHPEGFSLGWVPLSDVDKHLCHTSRRNLPDELWTIGDLNKLAKAIAYISRGLPISPPYVCLYKDVALVLGGGNHRYTIAKAINVQEIPIYVAPESKTAVSKILSIRWI